MNWKGTKDKLSKDEDFYVAAYNENGDYVADFDNQEYPAEEADAHLDLFIDAVHTIQKCDRLPSELLAERDEAITLIKGLLDWEEHDDLRLPGSVSSELKSFIKQIENGK